VPEIEEPQAQERNIGEERNISEAEMFRSVRR
jgi:hypothetical protein